MDSSHGLLEVKEKIQKSLGKEIVHFSVFGKGAVNIAYLCETADGEKIIVKRERVVKEFVPQNTLLVEARVAQELHKAKLNIPIPEVVFTAEDPMMYGYHYIEGEMMIAMWNSLSEEEKINICRTLGVFHAEIGKKISKESAVQMGVAVSDSRGLHPETVQEYQSILASDDVPEEFKVLARQAREIFDYTLDDVFFQFIHNDSHHENIICREGKIVGIIDFGNTEYGEIAKEFSRYIRDYPDYFQHIVSSYEKASGNNLSRARLVSNAFLSGLIDIVEMYRKGGDAKLQAEKAVAVYRRLFEQI